MSAAGLYIEYNSSSYHEMPSHTRGRGFHTLFDLRLNSDGTVDLALKADIYLQHGLALTSIWSFLGLLQIASLRYLRHHWRLSMWLHRGSASLLWAGTLWLGYEAIDHENWRLKDG